MVSHLAGRDSLTWKSGISRVTKKCKCVTDKEILLCRYVLFFFALFVPAESSSQWNYFNGAKFTARSASISRYTWPMPRQQHGQAPLSPALFPLAFSRLFCCNFSGSICLRIFCKSLSLPSSWRGYGAVPWGCAEGRKTGDQFNIYSSTTALAGTMRNLAQPFIDLCRNGFQHVPKPYHN